MDLRALNNDSEATEMLIKRIMRGINTSLPGIIVSFNAATQTAKVKPAIRALQTMDGAQTYLDLPELIEVPVYCSHSHGSGFSLTVPVVSGDECLLVFAQRSIDNWHLRGGVQNPVESVVPRSHNISDGFALVGFSSKPNAVGSYQSDCIEIRNADRTIRVSVFANKVELRNAAGSLITMSADGKISIVAVEVDITGDVIVTGNVTAAHFITS